MGYAGPGSTYAAGSITGTSEIATYAYTLAYVSGSGTERREAAI